VSDELAGWRITIERNDGKVLVSQSVPNDELEYGTDDALREARYLESNPS
jgi:hypothetical protein